MKIDLFNWNIGYCESFNLTWMTKNLLPSFWSLILLTNSAQIGGRFRKNSQVFFNPQVNSLMQSSLKKIPFMKSFIFIYRNYYLSLVNLWLRLPMQLSYCSFLCNLKSLFIVCYVPCLFLRWHHIWIKRNNAGQFF